IGWVRPEPVERRFRSVRHAVAVGVDRAAQSVDGYGMSLVLEDFGYAFDSFAVTIHVDGTEACETAISPWAMALKRRELAESQIAVFRRLRVACPSRLFFTVERIARGNPANLSFFPIVKPIRIVFPAALMIGGELWKKDFHLNGFRGSAINEQLDILFSKIIVLRWEADELQFGRQ